MKKRKRTKAITHKKKESFTAIKDSLLDAGKKFSEGADKVADIILNKRIKGKKTKGKKIKEETISMLKGVSSDIKRNLNGITLKDFLRDTSYTTGKATKITRDVLMEMFQDLW